MKEGINDIAEICHRLGIVHVVLSPGSRCAPLTLSFIRHGGFEIKTIADERSAAFIALGLSLETQKPTVLICTSGSAAYNYAPGVAEAFYQQVPLLVFTADRPPEWIGQNDGQTIQQNNIFGSHVCWSGQFPVELNHPDAQWHGNRLISTLFQEATSYPQGPVHLNIPLREPLYPDSDTLFKVSDALKVTYAVEADKRLTATSVAMLKSEMAQYNRVVLVVGQCTFSPALDESINAFCARTGIPVIADIIANRHEVDTLVQHQDLFLNHPEAKSLQPDLVLSIGASFVSKNLKLFLRQSRIGHWHIQPDGVAADPFCSLSKVIHTTEKDFFTQVDPRPSEEQKQYKVQWEQVNAVTKQYIQSQEFGYSEWTVYCKVMDTLPEKIDLHLANSMSVRYANFIGIASPKKGIRVFANRGTSGIDGSTSTALGTSFASGKPTVLITGDMAFFYDRNAFWNIYEQENLAVVLFNNQGGGIFNMIPGPAKQPEVMPYFVTEQKLSAKLLAQENSMAYFAIEKNTELEAVIAAFWQEKGAKILEIKTEVLENTAVFSALKSAFKNQNILNNGE